VLVILDISNISLGNEGADLIFDSLIQGTALMSLRMAGNEISEEEVLDKMK